MTLAYNSAQEHMDDALQLVELLFERQITAHRELGLLPPAPNGASSELTPAQQAAAHRETLDIKLVQLAETIEERLEATVAAGHTLPFEQLRTSFRLTPTEQRTLWILISVETSARLRNQMRHFVQDPNCVHADVGLLRSLVYTCPTTKPLFISETSPDSNLFRIRLAENVGSNRQVEEAPFLLRPIRASRRVIELVHGVIRLDPQVANYAQLIATPRSFDDLLIADEKKQQVVALLRKAFDADAKSPGAAVVVSGAEGSGRKSLLLGAANVLRCGILRISCDRLPDNPDELVRACQALLREATYFRAIPVLVDAHTLSTDQQSSAANKAQLLDHAVWSKFRGPLAATCPSADARPVSFSRGQVLIHLDLPTETMRMELWKKQLPKDISNLDYSMIASRYPVTGGVIASSAETAKAIAATREENTRISATDVHAGIRSTLDGKLSTLGVRVTWRQTWQELILPEENLDEIKEFIARVRHRRRVYEEWGFGRKVAKGLGLSALFSGEPGTGKTMVAGLIADALELDLYQIDLSRIVSKYVGETEKNLANLFDAAEAGHAILLFDEADSLFAKRTEVKSSIDRYANLEVNYLLQRMEAFSGITILTTNLSSSIDDAFRRRIACRIHFPIPAAEDRARLWRSMIPREAAVRGPIEYDTFADKYQMTGGYIRNAVLRAAFLAATEDSPITMEHLHRAANLEYAAIGKVMTSL